MMSREEVRDALTGPIASLKTPFTRDGAIDYHGLRRVIDTNLEGGSKTSLLTYGDSLFSLMVDDEIAEVTRVVAEQTGSRGMTVAADGGWATDKTVEFARYCQDVGVDVLMVKPPIWGESVTVDGFVEYYSAVAVEIPVMLVTNVWRANPGLGLQTIAELLERVDGIVAVKDDILGLFGRRMTSMAGQRWAVFSGGMKQHHLDLVHYGAVGFMSTFVTFLPRVTREYWDAVECGDWNAATRVIAEHDRPYFDYIGGGPGGYSAGFQAVQELYGLAGRWRRKPYYSLSDEEMDELRSFFQARGWL